MWSALALLLACSPAVRRIPPPSLPAAPRSEVPEASRAAYLHAAVIREQGDLRLAQLALTRARALDPRSPWLGLEAARLALAGGDAAAADALLVRLLGTEAEVEALALRAAVARAQGDLVRAELVITEAMTRSPERWELWAERLALLGAAGREAEARALVAAWARRPLVGGAGLAARGRARLAAGDAAGAVDDLGAALALGEPALAEALVEAARASGRLGAALGWLGRAEGAGVEEATLALARLAGDLPLEIETLEARLSRAPTDGASWAALASARRARGDGRGARSAAAAARSLGFTEAVEPARGRPEVRALLAEGRAALARQDAATALARARDAVDRAPASEAAWSLLADALAAGGRSADAAVAATRAARYAGLPEPRIE